MHHHRLCIVITDQDGMFRVGIISFAHLLNLRDVQLLRLSEIAYRQYGGEQEIHGVTGKASCQHSTCVCVSGRLWFMA